MKTHRSNGLALLFVSTILAIAAAAQQSAAPASNVPALPADIPADSNRWSVLTMSALAGQQAMWTTPDGKLHAFFQFNDRGRGPKTTTVMTLDANGFPSSEITDGNDYLKADVHEELKLRLATRTGKTRPSKAKRRSLALLFTCRCTVLRKKLPC